MRMDIVDIVWRVSLSACVCAFTQRKFSWNGKETWMLHRQTDRQCAVINAFHFVVVDETFSRQRDFFWIINTNTCTCNSAHIFHSVYFVQVLRFKTWKLKGNWVKLPLHVRSQKQTTTRLQLHVHVKDAHLMDIARRAKRTVLILRSGDRK